MNIAVSSSRSHFGHIGKRMDQLLPFGSTVQNEAFTCTILEPQPGHLKSGVVARVSHNFSNAERVLDCGMVGRLFLRPRTDLLKIAHFCKEAYQGFVEDIFPFSPLPLMVLL